MTSPRGPRSDRGRRRSPAWRKPPAGLGLVDVDWIRDAACGTAPAADLPWLSDPDQVTPEQHAAMQATCQNCPVLSACDAYAARVQATAGFWAGTHRTTRPTAAERGRALGLDVAG